MSELTPILSESRLTWFDKVKASWCFDKVYEKVIICLCLTWSLFSILRWIFLKFL